MIVYQCSCGVRNKWDELLLSQSCTGCGRIYMGIITEGGTKIIRPTYTYKMELPLICDGTIKPPAFTEREISSIFKIADNSQIIKQLRVWLKEAEQEEDYERCAKLRDEIKALNQESYAL